jgi:CRISPR-associated endonuclease/helicase Cas3
VYEEFLLTTTSAKLADLAGGRISIPGDVQELVESVHGDSARFDWDNPGDRQQAAWNAYRGKQVAERGQAGLVAVPRARQVKSLQALHSLPGEEDEWEVATRLGAKSVRLLCAYVQTDGRRTLDPAGGEPIPEPGTGEKMPAAAVRAVMRRTIPVRADWFHADDMELLAPPQSWAEHPMLGDVRVLYQPVRKGKHQAVAVGGKTLHLDEDLGLVRR